MFITRCPHALDRGLSMTQMLDPAALGPSSGVSLGLDGSEAGADPRGRLTLTLLTGDDTTDQQRIRQAAPGPIDCVIDLLPPSAGAKVARTAIMTVRESGRVVLMGGVGMLAGDDLALPYPWIMRNSITLKGQWMLPARANVGMVKMVRGGLIDLEQFAVTRFALDDANQAVAHAASDGGSFRMTVIEP